MNDENLECFGSTKPLDIAEKSMKQSGSSRRVMRFHRIIADLQHRELRGKRFQFEGRLPLSKECFVEPTHSRTF